MTRIGLISDLHMEFSPWDFEEDPSVDLYICAGDIDSNIHRRLQWLEKHPKLFFILGNHDFYGGFFPGPNQNQRLETTKKLKIAGATLWTDLSNPLDWQNYLRNLSDSRCINFLSYEAYNKSHIEDRDFLLNSEADIIVSHHMPTYYNMSEKYKEDLINCCFATELMPLISQMKKKPKLWIFGHTHEEYDFLHEGIRFICHPRGYPGEQPWFKSYQPKIVEI